MKKIKNKKAESSIKSVISVLIAVVLGGSIIFFIYVLVSNNMIDSSKKIKELYDISNEDSNSITIQDGSIWNGEVVEEILMGNGTVENPYIISDAKEFAAFALSVENGTDYYDKIVVLKNNIYLNVGEFDKKTWHKWDPIGNAESGCFFNGIFDGNNYSISGLYVDNIDSGGLFEVLGSYEKAETVIKNLKINNSFINTYSDCGVIASFIVNSKVSNIEINGAILDSEYCGILSAYSRNVSFISCRSKNVTGANENVKSSFNTTFFN